MNKKELINKTVELLQENDVRKRIATHKTTLHISDDNGNKTDFEIKRAERGLLFTAGDVTQIIDAVLAIVDDTLKHGKTVTIRGYGTLGLKYRKTRTTKHPETGKPIKIKAHYAPKFIFGDTLKLAAKVYEMSLNDNTNGDINNDSLEESGDI